MKQNFTPFISQMGLKSISELQLSKFHVCQFSVVKSGIESTFGRNMLKILRNADGMEYYVFVTRIYRLIH